ncbi:glycosyltransferase family 4 protein [Candidatus Falkowbacteria bacterium]|nr:glycosyltransferase family 4 protein [Candidatus Falkowbacteria bacterium]
MRIAIDIRCLMEKELTGVGEYTFHLLKHLFEIDNKNQYYLFYNSRQNVRPYIPKFPKDNVHYCEFKWPNKLLNLSLILFNRPRLDLWLQRKHGTPAIDLFFFPNLSFFAARCPFVITAHDISFKFFPEFLDWKRRLWHKIIQPKKLFQRAAKIIAVSNNTREDLASAYGLNPKQIITILSGVANNYKIIKTDDWRFKEIKKRYCLPDKFILFLGTLEPRKNLETLIAAFQLFYRQHPEYNLVIAGKRGWKCAEIEKDIARTPNVLCVHFIKDAEKRYFYNAATMFIYPSYYEGFGFPPLEAMACGCPTIISNNSSLTEICGSAALLINPFDVNDLVRAMNEMLIPEVAQSYRAKGIERARQFNWYTTAQKLLNVFNAIKEELC